MLHDISGVVFGGFIVSVEVGNSVVVVGGDDLVVGNSDGVIMATALPREEE